DTATAAVGNYAITGVLSDGTGQASNYTISTSGTLFVNQAPLFFTIANDGQAYGSPANLANDLPGTIATGVNGETLSITYSSSGGQLRHQRHGPRRHRPGQQLQPLPESGHAVRQPRALVLHHRQRWPDLRQPGQLGERPARYDRYWRQRRDAVHQLLQQRRYR